MKSSYNQNNKNSFKSSSANNNNTQLDNILDSFFQANKFQNTKRPFTPCSNLNHTNQPKVTLSTNPIRNQGYSISSSSLPKNVGSYLDSSDSDEDKNVLEQFKPYSAAFAKDQREQQNQNHLSNNNNKELLSQPYDNNDTPILNEIRRTNSILQTQQSYNSNNNKMTFSSGNQNYGQSQQNNFNAQDTQKFSSQYNKQFNFNHNSNNTTSSNNTIENMNKSQNKFVKPFSQCNSYQFNSDEKTTVGKDSIEKSSNNNSQVMQVRGWSIQKNISQDKQNYTYNNNTNNNDRESVTKIQTSNNCSPVFSMNDLLNRHRKDSNSGKKNEGLSSIASLNSQIGDKFNQNNKCIIQENNDSDEEEDDIDVIEYVKKFKSNGQLSQQPIQQQQQQQKQQYGQGLSFFKSNSTPMPQSNNRQEKQEDLSQIVNQFKNQQQQLKKQIQNFSLNKKRGRKIQDNTDCDDIKRFFEDEAKSSGRDDRDDDDYDNDDDLNDFIDRSDQHPCQKKLKRNKSNNNKNRMGEYDDDYEEEFQINNNRNNKNNRQEQNFNENEKKNLFGTRLKKKLCMEDDEEIFSKKEKPLFKARSDNLSNRKTKQDKKRKLDKSNRRAIIDSDESDYPQNKQSKNKKRSLTKSKSQKEIYDFSESEEAIDEDDFYEADSFIDDDDEDYSEEEEEEYKDIYNSEQFNLNSPSNDEDEDYIDNKLFFRSESKEKSNDNNQNKKKKKLIKGANLGEIESFQCTVCLDDPEEQFGEIDCFHRFCFECIENWSKVTNQCPVCRKEFYKIIKRNFNGTVNNSKPTLVRRKKQKVNEEDYIEEAQALQDEEDRAALGDQGADNPHEEPTPCYKCDKSDRENLLLVCDVCDENCCHTFCDEKIRSNRVPEGRWACHFCRA